MEKFEIYELNYWDAITMIPIFLCAFIVNNVWLSYSFIFMGIVGFLHHLFINSYRILLLDMFSVSITSIVFTIISQIPQGIKDFIYFIQLFVNIFLLYCFILNVRYPNRILLIIVSLIWLPLVIFSIKYISHASGFIGLIAIFLYMSSVTLCNKNPFVRFSWPLMHIIVAILVFFVLYEMDYLRPEIYKPIENLLDYIVDIKENMISKNTK